jgi:hypothetical protein
MALDDADHAATLDIDLITASLRADMSDIGAFVEALATKLEQTVPGAVQVERRREGLLGPKLVRRISLDAGGRRLELSRSGAGVETRWLRLSGGIVLKSETIDTDAWLAALGQALAAQARRSEITRRALERLLNG